MSDIRFMKREELKEASSLADRIFRVEGQPSMGDSFPSIFSGNYESSIGLYEDERLLSFMGLVPSMIAIGKASVPLYSLGSVCTDAESRGKGHAGMLLHRAFQHIRASGGSLLFVSGTGSLYTRNGCKPFGSGRSYRLTQSVAQQNKENLSNLSNLSNTSNVSNPLNSSNLLMREAKETDRLTIQQLSEQGDVRYQRSLYETAELLRVGALAGIYKLKHSIYVAESNGEVIAYALLALKGEVETTAVPFVVEWGGDASAVMALMTSTVLDLVLLELQVFVPWHEARLLQTLQHVPHEEMKFSGTVKIVNPALLWKQISSYLSAKDEASFVRIGIQNIADAEGAAVLLLDDEKITLDPQQLVSLLFDVEPDLPLAAAPYSALLGSLFPVPLPNPSGLNFV